MAYERCTRCQGYFGRNEAGLTVHPHCDVDDRTLLLQLLASLTLCDHMGDVSNDVDNVLKRLGIEVPEPDDGEWMSAVGSHLGRMGVTTLHGTSMGDDDE